MRNSVHEQRGDQRAERRRAACSRRGTAGACRRAARPSAPSAPPPVTATTCAPASRHPGAIDSVSSVSPEYDSANTSVRGPTNAGRAILLQHVDRDGERRRRDRVEHVARRCPSRPCRPRRCCRCRRRDGRSDGSISRRGLVRGGELLGQPARPRRGSPGSRWPRSTQPRTSGGCRRPRPSRSGARARRRRPPRPRRSSMIGMSSRTA